MHTCPNCNSANVRTHGKEKLTVSCGYRQRHICNDCKKTFTVSVIPKSCDSTTATKYQKLVITSCQNNTSVNNKFLSTLHNYCNRNNAGLMIIPTIYNPQDKPSWNVDHQYLCNTNIELKSIRIYGALKIIPTAENPLSGLDPLSKGKTVIVGHNQLQMRALPVSLNMAPAILHTTGTISDPNYIVSKQGEKANFNHSYSALVIEFDNATDNFHLRVLNADTDNGFYDLDKYYDCDGGITENCHVAALVTGDEHAMFVDPQVKAATYTGENSIITVLKPSIVVRHDVLDFWSGSHHHKHDFFTQYSKHLNGSNRVLDELLLTEQYLTETTPSYVKNWIVGSNHHDHLTKWLNTTDPKTEVWNAELYHWLMWQMIQSIKNDIKITPFELWLKREHSKLSQQTVFLSRTNSNVIKGIDVSLHGDKGVSGVKGTPTQYSKLPQKTITGHSHSPFIKQGAYGVGCSCVKNMSYIEGPGNWIHCHAVIHNNGKRQLIMIVDGKWRLE